MESKERRYKKVRIKKPETFAGKFIRPVKRQLGKNEDGKYQWEIIIGVIIAIILMIAFAAYVYLNIIGGGAKPEKKVGASPEKNSFRSYSQYRI